VGRLLSPHRVIQSIYATCVGTRYRGLITLPRRPPFERNVSRGAGYPHAEYSSPTHSDCAASVGTRNRGLVSLPHRPRWNAPSGGASIIPTRHTYTTSVGTRYSGLIVQFTQASVRTQHQVEPLFFPRKTYTISVGTCSTDASTARTQFQEGYLPTYAEHLRNFHWSAVQKAALRVHVRPPLHAISDGIFTDF
jgi:hypothetical protein